MIRIFTFLILVFIIGCSNSYSTTFKSMQNQNTNLLAIETGETYRYKVENGDNIKLKNAPKGMSIYPDGTIVWTPTDNQTGLYNVKIYKGNSFLKEITLRVKYKPIKYNGYFVDFSYSGEEKGTPTKPFSSIKSACQKIMNGNYRKTEIYIRGGFYKNKGFGKGLENGSLELIKGCNGTSEHYIHIKPWGDERVVLMSDGNAVFSFRNSSYIYVEGFELKGVADKITFEEVLKYWWNSKPYYKGHGISINKECHHINIRKNVIHDFSGAGIAIHNSDAVKIENNIIYDCVWWSIAGTGGIVLTQSKEIGNDESLIKGNLIFDVESRVFSRVFKKGFSKLIIDEGEAILVQEDKDTGEQVEPYNKNYHIEDNFLAFNGKGIVVNRADRSYIKNNSMYMSEGLRVGNDSSNVYLSKNAIEVKNNRFWVSIGKKNTENVFVQKNFYNQTARKKYDRRNENIYFENNTPVEKVFRNPLTFTLSSEIRDLGVGASKKQWKTINRMLKRYDIKIKPTNWELTDEKVEYMTNAILKGAKQLSPNVVIDCRKINSNKPRIVIKNIPKDFVRENGLPSSTFKLYLKYHYSGELCDIR